MNLSTKVKSVVFIRKCLKKNIFDVLHHEWSFLMLHGPLVLENVFLCQDFLLYVSLLSIRISSLMQQAGNRLLRSICKLPLWSQNDTNSVNFSALMWGCTTNHLALTSKSGSEWFVSCSLMPWAILTFRCFSVLPQQSIVIYQRSFQVSVSAELFCC